MSKNEINQNLMYFFNYLFSNSNPNFRKVAYLQPDLVTVLLLNLSNLKDQLLYLLYYLTLLHPLYAMAYREIVNLFWVFTAVPKCIEPYAFDVAVYFTINLRSFLASQND